MTWKEMSGTQSLFTMHAMYIYQICARFNAFPSLSPHNSHPLRGNKGIVQWSLDTLSNYEYCNCEQTIPRR